MLAAPARCPSRWPTDCPAQRRLPSSITPTCLGIRSSGRRRDDAAGFGRGGADRAPVATLVSSPPRVRLYRRSPYCDPALLCAGRSRSPREFDPHGSRPTPAEARHARGVSPSASRKQCRRGATTPAEHVRERVREVGEEVEPKLRGWLHASTVPLALAAGIVLIVLSPTLATPVEFVAVSRRARRCCCSPSRRFTTAAPGHPRTHAMLRRFDHSNIFLLIAGSYTPFTLILLEGSAARLVAPRSSGPARSSGCCSASSGSMRPGGSTRRSTWRNWVARHLLRLVTSPAVALPVITLIAVGGALYTLGGLVYGLKKPDPFPTRFGFHEVFHKPDDRRRSCATTWRPRSRRTSCADLDVRSAGRAVGTLERFRILGHDTCVHHRSGLQGFTMAKRLKDLGLPYDSSRCPTTSAATGTSTTPTAVVGYKSLHIDTSKWRLRSRTTRCPTTGRTSRTTQLLHDTSTTTSTTSACATTITFDTAVDAPSSRWPGTAGRSRCRPGRPASTPTSSSPTVTTGSPHPDYPGHVRRRADPQPPTRPVRAGRLPRQVGDGGRHGQLGDGHLLRAVAAPDRRQALHLDAPRRVGDPEVPERQAGRQGDRSAVDPQGRPSRRRARRSADDRQHEDYGLPEPDHARSTPIRRCARSSSPGRVRRHPRCRDRAPRRRRVVFADGTGGRGRRDRVGDRLRRDVPVPRRPRPTAPRRTTVTRCSSGWSSRASRPLLPRARPAAADARQLRRAAVQAPRRLLTGCYALPSDEEQEEIMVADEALRTWSSTTPRRGTRSRSTSAATPWTCSRRSPQVRPAHAGRRAGRADQPKAPMTSPCRSG